MNDFFNFYRRYIHVRRDITTMKPFVKGDSPWGAEIFVAFDTGGWHDDATGRTGSPYDLLRHLHPLMTDYGIYVAYRLEIADHSSSKAALNKAAIESNLDWHRSQQVPYEEGGSPLEQLFLQSDIWKDCHYYNWAQRSEIGEPVSIFSWDRDSFDDPVKAPLVKIDSVPRVQPSQKDWLAFAHDPIAVEALKSSFAADVHLLPTEDMLLFHDYEKLINGKLVTCHLPDDEPEEGVITLNKVDLGKCTLQDILSLYTPAAATLVRDKSHEQQLTQQMQDIRDVTAEIMKELKSSQSEKN
jgi:hypothetical protein